MQVQDQNGRLAAIRAAYPKEGLFAEKEWLLSPDAFPIDRKSLADLEQLGHRLFVFQRACNQLYQLSVKGKQPEWVARYLDAGKPKDLIEFSRRKEIRDDLPRVIRPDLILTEKGYIIAEIDSVPGGIGLTGWLNQTYSSFDNDIIGGANGMLEGFRAVVPNGADIVISQESATYRPEIEWLAARLNQRHAVAGVGDSGQPGSTIPATGVFVFHDREELYARINQRVEAMFENGVIEEVQAAGKVSSTASQMIGFREIHELLNGEMSMMQCVAAIQQATRRYAKRQLTWFRRQTNFSPLNLSLLTHNEAMIVLRMLSERRKISGVRAKG